MAQRNLKPIVNDEPKETRLDWMSVEDIIGRPYQKPKLIKPHFLRQITPIEDENTLKFWLNNLRKKRNKKA